MKLGVVRPRMTRPLLLVAKGIATRSKKLLLAPGNTTSIKKLQVTKGIHVGKANDL